MTDHLPRWAGRAAVLVLALAAPTSANAADGDVPVAVVFGAIGAIGVIYTLISNLRRAGRDEADAVSSLRAEVGALRVRFEAHEKEAARRHEELKASILAAVALDLAQREAAAARRQLEQLRGEGD